MKLVEDWALAMWGQMWMPCWVVPQYSQAWRNIQGGFVHRVPALKNLQGLRLGGVPPNLCLEFVGFCGARNESC